MPEFKIADMLEEYERKRRRQVSNMRAMRDYVLGVFFALLGVFFFFRGQFNLEFNKSYPPDYIDKILGSVFIIYGSWRVYRGYKKKYFQ